MHCFALVSNFSLQSRHQLAFKYYFYLVPFKKKGHLFLVTVE